ncbi:hypothetical protein MON38_17295 [Hymenobacter sp. DH14]|uniref:DUF5117 domain-containing protein n=1 Tax=Hymenobacter cyanobacteriorum TaxID=2926463 RepID=A0A9X1VJ36_9BACT|nr:hypothetical protein [Hymenobacter cyanobacteriorum]MCI1189182.1 hypothetical protein [Hymenobacter cyanobacteriorum]
MKLPAFLFLLGLAACQPQAQTAHQPVAATPPPAEVTAVSAVLPAVFAPHDTLTAAAREMLRRYDLSALWQGATSGPQSTSVLEGFFGPDHYRFELAFTEVHRDAANPALYHVRGKCHYRKNVRPFTGTLLIRQVADLEPPYEFEDADNDAPNQSEAVGSDSAGTVYEQKVLLAHPREVRAELRIKEAPLANAGEMLAAAALQFYVKSNQRLGYLRSPFRSTDGLYNAGYLLINGSRLNISTRQVKQFVLADNVFAAAPDVYKDFEIGDRGGEMNPKYAHLGWTEKWENDEWWADSPKPKLVL